MAIVYYNYIDRHITSRWIKVKSHLYVIVQLFRDIHLVEGQLLGFAIQL